MQLFCKIIFYFASLCTKADINDIIILSDLDIIAHRLYQNLCIILCHPDDERREDPERSGQMVSCLLPF